MTVPDVLVVGAGPAGLATALVLARAGARVRVVDRARFPRAKLCGDTVNPGALSVLEALDAPLCVAGAGARQTLAARVRAQALPITGMRVTGPGGASVAADYPRGLRGAAITRRDLDHLLLDAAVAAGCAFDEGVAVRGPVVADDGAVIGVRAGDGGRSGTLRARMVIAADGRGSRVASALRLSAFARAPRRWAFGAYFEGVQGLGAHGEMHIRPAGYLGIAPLPDGVANVCVVRAFPPGGPVRCADPRLVIAQTIAADPALRDRFTAARRISGVTTLGPLAIEARRSGRPGLLLAGDAAGFIDPMTGDGLRFALRGGVLAAEAALQELATGRPSWTALQAARRREFSGKWRVNRLLRTLAGSPRALALASSIAGRWADPVRYLVGVAGDVNLVPRRKARQLDARAPCGDEAVHHT
jgi:geranylgeranyl reductase family protein